MEATLKSGPALNTFLPGAKLHAGNPKLVENRWRNFKNTENQ